MLVEQGASRGAWEVRAAVRRAVDQEHGGGGRGGHRDERCLRLGPPRASGQPLLTLQRLGAGRAVVQEVHAFALAHHLRPPDLVRPCAAKKLIGHDLKCVRKRKRSTVVLEEM